MRYVKMMEDMINTSDIPKGMEFEVDYKFYEGMAVIQLFLIEGPIITAKTIAEIPIEEFDEWVHGKAQKKINNAIAMML